MLELTVPISRVLQWDTPRRRVFAAFEVPRLTAVFAALKLKLEFTQTKPTDPGNTLFDYVSSLGG